MTAPALTPPRTAKKPHLHSIDVVRVMTVALVISVHSLAFQPGGIRWFSGAVVMVVHVSREIFFLLTAFVLTYSYKDRENVRWAPFWRKRYLLIGVPYLVWSLIYFLAVRDHWKTGDFLYAVATGTARYHLYFLLVSMQLYLIFPLLRSLLRVTEGHHGRLLTAAVIYQLAVYGLIKHWIAQPDSILLSYAGFIVAGAVAARHAEEFLGWTRLHRRTVLLAALGSAALGIAWYAIQVTLLGRDITTAGDVFQPMIVVESFGIAWAFLAIGLAWQDRGMPGRRLFRTGADASFGVYLAHPLLLQGIIAVLVASGLQTRASHLPDVAVTAITLLVGVPVIYLTCAAVAAGLRRTPLSLPLTGHQWRRGRAVVAPAAPVPPGGLRCEQQTV